MAYAIELFLDQETCKHIRRVWERLHDLGIGGPLYDSGAFPHITLSIFDELDLESSKRNIELLAERFPSFELSFTEIATFTEARNVVFLKADESSTLTSMKEYLSRALATTAAEEWYYSRDERWVPHVTLAIDVPAEQIQAAVEIASHIPLPLIGSALKVGVVQLEPLKHLASRDL
jgi:2'-5' RNA ligase